MAEWVCILFCFSDLEYYKEAFFFLKKELQQYLKWLEKGEKKTRTMKKNA